MPNATIRAASRTAISTRLTEPRRRDSADFSTVTISSQLTTLSWSSPCSRPSGTSAGCPRTFDGHQRHRDPSESRNGFIAGEHNGWMSADPRQLDIPDVATPHAVQLADPTIALWCRGGVLLHNSREELGACLTQLRILRRAPVSPSICLCDVLPLRDRASNAGNACAQEVSGTRESPSLAARSKVRNSSSDRSTVIRAAITIMVGEEVHARGTLPLVRCIVVIDRRSVEGMFRAVPRAIGSIPGDEDADCRSLLRPAPLKRAGTAG